MKKLLVIICSISVIWCLIIAPVSAASTVFEDKADSKFTKVDTKVGVWQFEDNKDVDKTFYSKGEGSKDLEISLVYKMNGNISAFKIDTLNVNGLGNSVLDVAVYVSSNGTSWTKVETSVTAPVMDPAYLTIDLAYWLNSTVSNKGPVPANITYLKVSLMPFTRKDMVAWSTVLDDIFITYDAKADLPPTKAASSTASSLPASQPVSNVKPSNVSSAVNTIAPYSSEVASIVSSGTSLEDGSGLNSSQATLSSALASDKKGSDTPIIVGAIVLGSLAIASTLFFVLRNKK